MKTALTFLFATFIALACSSSKTEISPSDQLYKRWKSVEYGKYGKDWRKEARSEVIEFKFDGTILYEDPEYACCSPTKVARDAKNPNVLEIGQTSYCINASCVALTHLHILSISDTDLIIDYRYGKNSAFSVHYEAVP